MDHPKMALIKVLKYAGVVALLSLIVAIPRAFESEVNSADPVVSTEYLIDILMSLSSNQTGYKMENRTGELAVILPPDRYMNFADSVGKDGFDKDEAVALLLEAIRRQEAGKPAFKATTLRQDANYSLSMNIVQLLALSIAPFLLMVYYNTKIFWAIAVRHSNAFPQKRRTRNGRRRLSTTGTRDWLSLEQAEEGKQEERPNQDPEAGKGDQAHPVVGDRRQEETVQLGHGLIGTHDDEGLGQRSGDDCGDGVGSKRVATRKCCGSVDNYNINDQLLGIKLDFKKDFPLNIGHANGNLMMEDIEDSIAISVATHPTSMPFSNDILQQGPKTVAKATNEAKKRHLSLQSNGSLQLIELKRCGNCGLVVPLIHPIIRGQCQDGQIATTNFDRRRLEDKLALMNGVSKNIHSTPFELQETGKK